MKPQVYHSKLLGDYIQGFATTKPTSDLVLVTEYELTTYLQRTGSTWDNSKGGSYRVTRQGVTFGCLFGHYDIYDDIDLKLYMLRYAVDEFTPTRYDWLIHRSRNQAVVNQDIRTSPLWLEAHYENDYSADPTCLYVCAFEQDDASQPAMLDVYNRFECAEKVLTVYSHD